MLQYIVFSVVFISGLLLTLVQAKLGATHYLYLYISQIASTLLVGGTVSILYKVFVDRANDRQMQKYFKIHESILDTGLIEVLVDSKTHNYAPMITESTSLTIILNDGFRWLSTYSVEFTKRFSRSSSITEIFLVDPNGQFLPALAHKTDLLPQDLGKKIQQSVDFVMRTYNGSDKSGALKIYYLKNYPTQSIFCTEREVLITPYQTSSGRRTVPLYIYQNTKKEICVATEIIKDIEALRRESTTVFDSSIKV